MAQGTLYVIRFQLFLYGLVFELVSTVCVEQADIFKASFHALEGSFYQLCRFMFPCAVSYDFTVKEVNRGTHM